MAFDYKKAYPELYLPKAEPSLVRVPPMNYAAVRGRGDPNREGGAYQQAIAALYAVAYTVKMSKRGNEPIGGYFDFVVPPLEGFWWQTGTVDIDYARKQDFEWIACIRMPEYVTGETLLWAARTVEEKKKADTSKVEFLHVEEGLCVQILHVGDYDSEPESVARMNAFMQARRLAADFTEARRHHEIYLSDPRRTAPEKLKTVIRHPVRENTL